MITAEQLRAQYRRNAEDLGKMVEAARIATNAGQGGPKGKRYNGYFFHQLVQMHSDRIASSQLSDAELAPMLDLINAAFSKKVA